MRKVVTNTAQQKIKRGGQSEKPLPARRARDGQQMPGGVSQAVSQAALSRGIANAAKVVANDMIAKAACRADFSKAAVAYAEAIRQGMDMELTAQEDGDLLGTLWSNEAYALLRSGDYSAAKSSADAALGCGAALPEKVREKAKARLKLAKAGLKLLSGNMGRCTMCQTADVPDSWFTQDPDSDIVRMCWGWRSELEVAVRESRTARVAKLIAGHDLMEVRCFIECRTLLEKAASLGNLDIVKLLVEEACVKGIDGIDGMRQGCPDGWEMCRRGGGYNGCTPLYGAAQGGPDVLGNLDGRTAVAAYLLARGADPMVVSDKGITPLFIAVRHDSPQP